MNTVNNMGQLPMLYDAGAKLKGTADRFSDYCRTLMDWEEPLDLLQKLVNPDDGDLMD
ncbi:MULTISPECIES: hypothetical protein [Paenibacillus]|uniref:hypothetical protein n=1 Tax=Paenibacillus TaxID=44249 RepID=UPI00168B4D24|nr:MULTISPECIES: hypothetical protein [Paenibacillus]